MTGTFSRRLAKLEALAVRLLPSPPGDFEPLRWLSSGELDRLQLRLEEAGEAGAADLWSQLHRRAVARALLNTDAAALDEQERRTCQLLRIDHPDRPADPIAKLYIAATEDLVERGRWHLDDWYVRRWPSLPATLTTAELALYDPRPWPPGVAAGEVPP
jgi:hypothetical protein